MPSEAYLVRKRKYICEHRRKHYKTVSFALRFDREMDIIEFLDKQPSRQKFIIDAIKEAIARETNK